MTVAATTATDAAGLATRTSISTIGTGKATMDQTDFLKLLTTQLQTQDPFEPVDNTQMVSQMATITNSSGIAEMNKSLAAIKDQLTGSRLGDAASWIGKAMLVKSNIAAPDAAGSYAGQVTMAADSNAVGVDLIDAGGNVVKSIDMGAIAKDGKATFYWDGKDADGNRVATSGLQVKVNGGSAAQVSTWTQISSVQSPSDGTASRLVTPLGTYAPADAIELG